MYVCFSRDTGILNFAILKVEIIKVRKTKEEIARNIKVKNFVKNGTFFNIITSKIKESYTKF